MNSTENSHLKPYGLNTIVEVLGLFWFFWLFVQFVSAYYTGDTMTFDGVTFDDILLLYIRYAKLLFGIMIFPVVYTLLKGKVWSLNIFKALFIILIGLIGLEIVVGYIFYEQIETSFIFYNLPAITLLLLFLYYFTRTHVKRYLFK
jgi:hypothetical protein